MDRIHEIEFLEPNPDAIEDLNGTSIADIAKLRRRLRLNRTASRSQFHPEGHDAPLDLEYERIIVENDLVPFYVLALGAELGRAVCKIAFADGHDGTGFLVAPDILLTNNHVLWSIERAEAALCYFDFELGVDRQAKPRVEYRLKPQSLFLTSSYDPAMGLDYTFVRIEPEAGRKYKPIRMSRGSFTNIDTEWANIVQHPRGEMKQLALHNNRIIADSGVTIHYVADTDGGSSGAPVFNSDWQLIGLHHAAQPMPVFLRRRPDLGPRRAELKEYGYVNEAVKLSAIAAHVEKRLGGPEDKAAREVLGHFTDTDSLLGYFGTAGRPETATSAVKQVIEAYAGDPHDIDVGFWNLAWLSERYEERAPEVARLIAQMQLDIYALFETSHAAAAHLVTLLSDQYGLKFKLASDAPTSDAGHLGVVILWNAAAVERLETDWPEEVRDWFDTESAALAAEGGDFADGRIFRRAPELVRFKALNRAGRDEAFVLDLLPLHRGALAEDAVRERQAGKILSAAIAKIVQREGAPDLLAGGDFDALQLQEDIARMDNATAPLSAENKSGSALTYIKTLPSLVERIYLPRDMTHMAGAKAIFALTAEIELLEQARLICGRRPLLARLSLRSAAARASTGQDLAPGLAEMLKSLLR